MKKKFAVIGGDLRSLKLANLLESEGNSVLLYGFNNVNSEIDIKENIDLKSIIDCSDVVIGPLPLSNDNETINAPYFTDKIYINELFKLMTKKQLFLAGKITSKIAHLAQVFNVCHIDILEREELSVLNAIPTAEGAIQLAMEEMPITLHNSNSLVIGFGRIGKILSKMLNGLGSNVYVEARKCSDIAWINGYGYNPVFINDLINNVSKMDVIFNTVPNIILDAPILNRINKECLLIDLASKPGGIDFNKADELGLKTRWALSLPGKVAPITAAKFIKDTIYNIINELGV